MPEQTAEERAKAFVVGVWGRLTPDTFYDHFYREVLALIRDAEVAVWVQANDIIKAGIHNAEAAQRERDAVIAESELCMEEEPTAVVLEALERLGVVEARRVGCRITKRNIAAAIRRAGEG